MENGYQEQKTAQNYIDFLESTNGKIQRAMLLQAIMAALPAGDVSILDAACGTGWLAAELKPRYPKIYACDSSGPLIAHGKQRYPAVEFSHCDVSAELPYPAGFFDVIILNMAGPDIADLEAAMKNLAAKIKMGGRLIMTIPNPYYTYPVAVWKKTMLDVLLGRKPRLKISDEYKTQKNITREFGDKTIASNFYTLNDYTSAAKESGLNLNNITELKSQTDSGRFDLNYQMFRYPLILLLEFSKT